jgi:hypothetical protein
MAAAQRSKRPCTWVDPKRSQMACRRAGSVPEAKPLASSVKVRPSVRAWRLAHSWTVNAPCVFRARRPRRGLDPDGTRDNGEAHAGVARRGNGQGRLPRLQRPGTGHRSPPTGGHRAPLGLGLSWPVVRRVGGVLELCPRCPVPALIKKSGPPTVALRARVGSRLSVQLFTRAKAGLPSGLSRTRSLPNVSMANWRSLRLGLFRSLAIQRPPALPRETPLVSVSF